MTPSPSTAAPDTSNPADDESMDDQPDDSTTGLPADDGNTPDQSVSFGPQMAASAGLDKLQVGDQFSVTITGTVTGNTDGTLTADIEDASDGMKTKGDAAMPPTMKKPQSRVIGPVEAGFQDEAGNQNL